MKYKNTGLQITISSHYIVFFSKNNKQKKFFLLLKAASEITKAKPTRLNILRRIIPN